jgi:predicted transposase YbfD/YdcC
MEERLAGIVSLPRESGSVEDGMLKGDLVREMVADTRLAKVHGFPGVQAVARIESVRRSEGKEEALVRYFLLFCWLSTAKLLDVVRTHWSIERQLHWAPDVVFDEDGARNRKDHGSENLAVPRKLASTFSVPIPTKLRSITRSSAPIETTLSFFPS